jgi:acyl-CoA synthetase (AMP-forming)/AMP-acid ligase II
VDAGTPPARSSTSWRPRSSSPFPSASRPRFHAQRPAVIGARLTLSYEALDRRANAVADGLLALGGRAGEHVALLLERDSWRTSCRQQLPPVARVRADLSRPFAPPQTPLEAALAALWAHALGLDAVGVHDPFIELGGDSLLALRLVDDIHAMWRVSLPQALLLKVSTVEAMARVILESFVDQEAPETMEAFLSRVEGAGPATEFRSGSSTA